MRQYLALVGFSLIIVACQKGPTLGPGNESQLASAAQADCGFVQNAYGERVSWKKAIPVVIKIHPTYPAEFVQTLQAAAEHWNDAAGMTLFRFETPSQLSSNKASRDSTNTIYWMMDWPEASRIQQGVTNLYWVGNQLKEADVSINNKNFNFYTTTPTTAYDVHLESLLVHELGHVLGLKHRNTVPSVMWSVLNGGVMRTALTQSDRETLKCEY